MKNTLIFTLLASAVLSACALHGEAEPDRAQSEVRKDVTVRVSGPSSRATGIKAGDEAAIGSLQVLVFDCDGLLDAVESGSGTSVSVVVTTGRGKRLWAVANAPKLTDIGSEDELKESVSNLQDNSLTGLVMVGNTTADITEDSDISISLSRLAARLSVKKITRQFDAPALAARPLTIKGIYLINVAAGVRYDASPEVPAWLNRRGFESSGADALLSERGLSIPLADGASHSTAHSFYCYPNPSATDSSSEDWSPRKTRLVLEAELGGNTCYYSLTFPEIKRNCTYTVENLTLSGKGSSTPDMPYARESISASVTVRDWTDGATYTEKL